MGFRSANIMAHCVTFNSAASCDFIDLYNNIVDNEIAAHNAKPKSKTFAPSSSHCDRINWFRLRGVQPDKIDNPDRGLDFTAKVGTALHEIIQQRLSTSPDLEWLSVSDYLMQTSMEGKAPFSYTCEQLGYETKVSVVELPVHFACDGLVRFKNRLYLLEIKSAEFSTLQDLTEPKPHHVEQVKCYSALTGIQDVLVLYIDRQYGSIKCFELHFSADEQRDTIQNISRIKELADSCIAPDKLPSGDSWCSSSMCPYYKKCKEW